MRFVVLIDRLIDKDDALAILNEFGDFIKTHTGIQCTFWLERRDFSVVPTVPDADGDLKPTYEYRQSLCKDVHDRYGDYGTDYVVMWVHEDNFLYKGIWGTAWAYTHFKYNFLLCRWDKDNQVNTFNTLWHEAAHPFDTTIFKESGIKINSLIAEHFGYSSFDFDRDFVHGNHPDWQYIGRRGYKREGKMLTFLAPYLRKAFGNREDKHKKRISMMTQVVQLLQTLVALLTKSK